MINFTPNDNYKDIAGTFATIARVNDADAHRDAANYLVGYAKGLSEKKGDDLSSSFVLAVNNIGAGLFGADDKAILTPLGGMNADQRRQFPGVAEAIKLAGENLAYTPRF